MKGSTAAKRNHRLTREALQGGFVNEMIARSGTKLRVLSDDERRASLEATLAAQPAPGDVWLFGYGSLIWNPAFHYVERKPVLIRGWHRQFCLSTPIGRGTPDQPGLVLGLDRGGSCKGVAFRVTRAEAEAELELVWRREMVTGAYVPRWVTLHAPDLPDGTSGIAFIINRAAPNYVRPRSEADTARVIATACGVLGSCRDYPGAGRVRDSRSASHPYCTLGEGGPDLSYRQTSSGSGKLQAGSLLALLLTTEDKAEIVGGHRRLYCWEPYGRRVLCRHWRGRARLWTRAPAPKLGAQHQDPLQRSLRSRSERSARKRRPRNEAVRVSSGVPNAL